MIVVVDQIVSQLRWIWSPVIGGTAKFSTLVSLPGVGYMCLDQWRPDAFIVERDLGVAFIVPYT